MASRPTRHRCRGFCARLGSPIKKTLLAEERARSDVAKLRNVWIHKRQPIMREIGQKKAALRAFKELLDVHPYWSGAKQAVEELQREVDGQGI